MRGRLNRYRFARICQHLQFENHSSNRDIPDSEKALARMKPFVNLLQNQFKSIYYPTRNLTISETKFGLYESVSHYDWLVETTEMPEAQVYELHDCTGFIYNICLHVANQTPAQTVQKLMKSLLGNGHAMYLSSTYSSVPLAHSLSEKNTYLTGTFLPSPTEDFKFPSEMFDSRCQSLKLESNKIFVGKLDCSLQPNLCTISTEFDHEETLRNVVAAEKPIPNCIYHYQNVLMTIFNREFVEFHSNAVNKGPKLYLQIFFHLINICIQNAYVLYKLNNLQSTMDFRQFRQQLVRTIFDLPVRAEVEESIPLDAHKPAKIVLTKGKRPIKRCVMCSARGCKTKFSTICCPDCPGQPTLCQNSKRNCFAEWHSNQQSSKTDEDESEF